MGNGGIDLIAEERPWMELPYSITITVPPMGGLVLRPDPLPKPAPIVALLAEDVELVEPDEEPLEVAASEVAANDEELAQPE